MERWLSCKGTCHVILQAKLHDMYLYKTVTFPHQPLKSVSKVALLHRFHCTEEQTGSHKRCLSYTVNFLKFRTFYSVLFWLKILLFMQQFLKIFSGMANSVDPGQTAPEGAV